MPSFTLTHLLNATASANAALDHARDAILDKGRKSRLAQRLCPACYYLRGTQHTNVSTTKDCELCSTTMQFGNSLVSVVCDTCATNHKLCKRCGADIELRERRKL